MILFYNNDFMFYLCDNDSYFFYFLTFISNPIGIVFLYFLSLLLIKHANFVVLVSNDRFS